MKIVTSFPPNYAQITALLGDVARHRPVFCYGDTIYNPFNRELTDDVIQHEHIHSLQQQAYMSPELWWTKYLYDHSYRMECELEAYGEQLKFARERGVKGKLLSWITGKFAEELSGEAYGSLMTYYQAHAALRHYKR